METKELTLSIMFGVLYVLLNFIPFSQFIGGSAFITIGVILLPVISALLYPVYATIAGLIGGLGISFVNVGLATVFPGFCIVITTVTALIGSLAFHYRRLSFIPAIWLIAQACDYLFSYNFQATPFWLVHYIIAMILVSFYAISKRFKVPILCFATAMVEQSLMNTGSIHLLGLPAPLWILILPFSLFERTFATIASTIILYALKKRGIIRIP